MPSQTYESQAYHEWLGKVNAICKREFGRSIYGLPVAVSFGEAYEDGATPEEFVEADLRPSLSSQPVNQENR